MRESPGKAQANLRLDSLRDVWCWQHEVHDCWIMDRVALGGGLPQEFTRSYWSYYDGYNSGDLWSRWGVHGDSNLEGERGAEGARWLGRALGRKQESWFFSSQIFYEAGRDKILRCRSVQWRALELDWSWSTSISGSSISVRDRHGIRIFLTWCSHFWFNN